MSSSSSSSSSLSTLDDFKLDGNNPNDWIVASQGNAKNAWNVLVPYQERSFAETLSTTPAFENLECLLGDQGRELSDVVVEIIPEKDERIVIHAHMFLLRIQSQIMDFVSDTGSEENKIVFDSTFGTDDFLKLIPEAIRYCYTSRLPDDAADCYGLMAVAEFLHMPVLTCHIMNWFEKRDHSVGDLVSMCKKSVKCGTKGNHVTECVLRKIAEQMDQVVRTKQVVDLSFVDPSLFLGMINEPKAMELKDDGIPELVGKYLANSEFEFESDHATAFVEVLDGFDDHDETMGLLKMSLETGAEEDTIQRLCHDAAEKFQVLVDEDKVNLNDLPVDVVVMILGDNELYVDNEDSVYDLASLYALQQESINDQKRVMDCVRFGLLSAETLAVAGQANWPEKVVSFKTLYKASMSLLGQDGGWEKRTPVITGWDENLRSRGVKIEGKKLIMTGSFYPWGLGKKDMKTGKHTWRIKASVVNNKYM